ncbi:MAG TPA: HEAT repeat domain-containing protein [Vicinamibacterales bacterium]|jgi:HEAT repeat protein|nr:HEAT repeat domain-containing protein [Vicinamibacterales bacterium]
MARLLPIAAAATVLFVSALAVTAQEPKAEAVSMQQVKAAVDRLGDLDFSSRMKAAQTVRRAPAAIASPALVEAVSSHTDGYVRFKALVLLAGLNDPRAKPLMLDALRDPNDRLRATAYAYFEDHPSADALAFMLPAYEREQSEFVRPSLTRALAAASVSRASAGPALGRPPARGAGSGLPADNVTRLQTLMRQAVTRGQDFFRSIAIEALGDHKATYALPEIVKVATLDGPLQDDAALAIGRIGDKSGLETLAAMQRSASKTLQPTVAAGICLLGVNCDSHVGYLVQTLGFAVKNLGFQELLRSTATGLAAVAAAGNADALTALFAAGIPARDPARAPIALAVGEVAIRNPAFLLRWFETRRDQAEVTSLLAESFDMLEEHYEEERFYVTVRRAYWQAPEGSATRRSAGTLIGKLEF